jgi:hypothetical protein
MIWIQNTEVKKLKSAPSVDCDDQAPQFLRLFSFLFLKFPFPFWSAVGLKDLCFVGWVS